MFKKTIPCSIVLILLWVCPAFSNIVPPTPTQHFYGDADGDTLITTFDLGILVNYFNGQPYTFDTLQPQNPDQDWNTCDIDSDQHCTTFDLGYYTNYFNGQTLGIGDKPWVLQNMDLPLAGNSPFVWIPFTVNLYSTLIDLSHSGRPGVSVIAEIAPVGEGSTVTGQLSGRECDPTSGERDQTAQDGAQCALSVTTTDWNAFPDQGLTESGTYGLQIWADGEGVIQINLRIEATELEVPAVATSIFVNFTINRPPNIGVDCPTRVGETQPAMCGVSVTDPESPPQELTCALSEATVCPGVVLNGCETVSVPEQGEAYGPEYCLVVVDVEDDANPPMNAQAYDFMAIDEENQAPTINVDCPVSVPKNETTYCQLSTSDSDLPSQELTCEVDTSTTCMGVSLLGCNWAYVPAQGVAPVTCSVVMNVHDDFSPPGSGQGADNLNVLEANTIPSIIVDCPERIGETQSTTCPLIINDPDLPPQTLMCTLSEATSCTGVTLTGCTQANVPAQGELVGPGGLCSVVVIVQDDYYPPGSAEGSDAMAIDEDNQSPIWIPPPTNIVINVDQSYNQNNGRATDADYPGTYPTDPGHLTCVKTGQTCSFPITVSGSGIGTVDCRITFTAGASEETCGLDIRVSDGYGVYVESSITITLPRPCITFVNDDAPGQDDGSSWTDARRSLQDAINNTSSGCQLWVAEGTYSFITMKSGVKLFGGFVGSENLLSERGTPSDHPSVIDGQNAEPHVVTGASNARLDGFKITRGHGIGTGDSGAGAGMFIKQYSNLVVANCNFTGNYAYIGGGIYIYNASPAITNCVFNNNTTYGTYESGGGIYIDFNASPNISGCSFTNNISAGWGGALMTDDHCYPTITNCTFSNNRGTHGGAIYNYTRSILYISKCVFTNNQASGNGGVIADYESGAVITNCVFTGNTADRGGAISGGTAGSYVYTITNCTFTRNKATYGNGGALLITASSVKNSILWGDTAPTDPEIYGSVTVTYSDVQGGYAGTGNINTDPIFVGYPNVRLQSGSLCIDAGTSSGAPGSDLDGYPRPYPIGGAYDMGAYEWHP